VTKDTVSGGSAESLGSEFVTLSMRIIAEKRQLESRLAHLVVENTRKDPSYSS